MWGSRWRRSKEGKVSGSEEGRDKGGYRYRLGIRRKGEQGEEEGKDKGGLKVGNIEGRNESEEILRNARFGRVKLKLGRGIEML